MYIKHVVSIAVTAQGDEMLEFVEHVVANAKPYNVPASEISFEVETDEDDIERLEATFFYVSGEDAE